MSDSIASSAEIVVIKIEKLLIHKNIHKMLRKEKANWGKEFYGV